MKQGNYLRQSPPLPERLARLLRESRWLLLVALALYFILILHGYDRNDPAWSHSGTDGAIHNPGGVIGAWLADVLFYLFGFSAWWWVLLLVQRVRASYGTLHPDEPHGDSLFDPRALWLTLIGFAVLLASSSALEALRLYSWKMALPQEPGGMLGTLLAKGLSHLLGFTGATLLLLVLMATTLSVFSGLSWLRLSEWLGGRIEIFYLWARRAWQTRQDKRIGAQAVSERQALVQEEKKRVEEHLPIHIEQPVVEVQQSARAVQEKQASLF
ncbi:MAG TPA: DNA translocase FtsK 4TM domain-containing protein, partial [Gallionellaceae bacterium]|nr:DNA translocase FtsK 4TM domain-containing protein [Gallionellaceae bacterium]